MRCRRLLGDVLDRTKGHGGPHRGASSRPRDGRLPRTKRHDLLERKRSAGASPAVVRASCLHIGVITLKPRRARAEIRAARSKLCAIENLKMRPSKPRAQLSVLPDPWRSLHALRRVFYHARRRQHHFLQSSAGHPNGMGRKAARRRAHPQAGRHPTRSAAIAAPVAPVRKRMARRRRQ